MPTPKCEARKRLAAAPPVYNSGETAKDNLIVMIIILGLFIVLLSVTVLLKELFT